MGLTLDWVGWVGVELLVGWAVGSQKVTDKHTNRLRGGLSGQSETGLVWFV